MYRNYLKVAFRNMRKHKAFSVLNLLGLAVGIAACLLIIVHVQFQLSFENFNPQSDKVHRVISQYGYETRSYGGWTPALLISTLKEEYPEIVQGARIYGPMETIVKVKDRFVSFDQVISADSTFFELFPNTFLAGSEEGILTQPNELVITESLAETFFPEENPVGQILKDGNGNSLTIKAVVKDVPNNTSVPYKAIMSFPHERWVTNGWWTGNNFFSYVKLDPNTDLRVLESKMPDFVKRHIAPEMMEALHGYETFDDWLADGNYKSYRYVPLSSIHLHHPRLDLGKPGSFNNVVTFTIIAFFILIVACINYLNMSTAKSSLRAKEVGLRKVMGSIRKSVIQQFLTESMLVTVIATLLGVVIAALSMPYFNYLTNLDYTLGDLFAWQNLLWVLAIIVVVGLLAGSYPALHLSSFQPIAAMRGEKVRGGSSKLRVALVIFQFAVSTFLISATVIVYQQITHLNRRDLGLNTEQVLVVKNARQLDRQYQPFRNQLLGESTVEEIGVLSAFPSGWIADWNYSSTGDNPIQVSADHMFADEYGLQSLDLELVEGSFFTGAASDTAAVVVNETFCRLVGWQENRANQMLSRGRGEKYRVIGVVKDFVLTSGKHNVRPLLYRYDGALTANPDRESFLHIRLSGDYAQALAQIESTWEEFVPGYPFDAFFLDDSFSRHYDAERRFGQLFTSFSGLAILIALVGLFALAAFTLEKRMKEIAVRKVLGATASRLVRMIVWHFLRLVLVGAVIAAPVAYYLGNSWLANYQYRINIEPEAIFIPILMVSVVALVTVSLRSYNTAKDNPVNALKQE